MAFFMLVSLIGAGIFYLKVFDYNVDLNSTATVSRYGAVGHTLNLEYTVRGISTVHQRVMNMAYGYLENIGQFKFILAELKRNQLFTYILY